MNNTIVELKSKNEDFEFYPTTNEIINSLIEDIKNIDEPYNNYNKFESFIDIGAGNGKVLKSIEKAFNLKMFAIEKSKTLRDLINQNFYIVGTDFHEQSLLDKKIDISFCNPPYSEFIKWSVKIIKESCSKYVYLVIPERWNNSSEIEDALKYRNAKYEIIGEYSFHNAEDRAARARVNLIRIKLDNNKDDAFDRFFAKEFKELKNKFNEKEQIENIIKEKGNKFSALVTGKDYVHNLVSMYNYDIEKIKNNYLYVQKLDVKLLDEFGITVEKILELLKERLKGLKNLYWNELISRMEEITNKLTAKYRQQLLETLNKNVYVDFTESNIYSVVLWILKNAGDYVNAQVLDIYEQCISKANCKNYKSNKKVFEDDNWRYKNKATHVFLEYRLIFSFWGAIEKCYQPNQYRLSERACDYLKDLLTVANNLGFKTNTLDHRLNHWNCLDVWKPGKAQIFEYIKDGKTKTLFEVKAHLNGNIHLKLNQEFALSLNVEFGRLKGWIHNAKEAQEELFNKDADKYFKTSNTLLDNPFMIEYK